MKRNWYLSCSSALQRQKSEVAKCTFYFTFLCADAEVVPSINLRLLGCKSLKASQRAVCEGNGRSCKFSQVITILHQILGDRRRDE